MIDSKKGRKEQSSYKTARKQLIGWHQSVFTYRLPIKNYSKCKWIEFSNKMAKCGCMDEKIGPNCMMPMETHFNFKDTHRLKVKG